MTSAWDLDSANLLQSLYPDEVTLARLLAGLGFQIAQSRSWAMSAPRVCTTFRA